MSLGPGLASSLLALVLVGCAGGAWPDPAAPTGTVHPATGVVADVGGDGGPTPAVPAASRCFIDPVSGDISCSYQTITIESRQVLYQTPLGVAPGGGWPVVLLFQPSFYGHERLWSASKSDLLASFGTYTQTMVIKRLLDAGLAVVAPDADLISTVWDTNVPPWQFAWPLAPDHRILLALFDRVDAGELGPLSHSRWYAAGLSSGGYMTSRMAVSYAGRFKALAIASASYATCGGPLCVIPELPADHPPTLFLHGGSDIVVPAATMYAYRTRLMNMAVPTRAVLDPAFKHGWIPPSPDEVLQWFSSY